ncbi:hypothetical protein VPHK299_0054 [Vibrio phage K299]
MARNGRRTTHATKAHDQGARPESKASADIAQQATKAVGKPLATMAREPKTWLGHVGHSVTMTRTSLVESSLGCIGYRGYGISISLDRERE